MIDPEQRAALAARSPYNVVAIDLPEARAATRTRTPRSCSRAGSDEGAVVRDDEPALWALAQDYTGPDGRALTRHGFFARVRVEDYGPGRIRPHERTHPGPKEDRLRLTRATRANLSPIFCLYDDPAARPGAALEPHAGDALSARLTDDDGTRQPPLAGRRPEAIAAVAARARPTPSC